MSRMVPDAAFRPLESRTPKTARRDPSLVARVGSWWTRVRGARAPTMVHARRLANEQAAHRPTRQG